MSFYAKAAYIGNDKSYGLRLGHKIEVEIVETYFNGITVRPLHGKLNALVGFERKYKDLKAVLQEWQLLGTFEEIDFLMNRLPNKEDD